jgi:hypothetical protein
MEWFLSPQKVFSPSKSQEIGKGQNQKLFHPNPTIFL